MKHLKYYLQWYSKNMIPAFVRFLRISGIIPPINNKGIQVGDKVKVIGPELNYGDHIGIVADNNSQTVYDDFIIKVEFPTIPKTEGSLLSVFTEYFAPDELDVINEV